MSTFGVEPWYYVLHQYILETLITQSAGSSPHKFFPFWIGGNKTWQVIVPLIELKGFSCLSRCTGFHRSPVPLSAVDFSASRRPDGRLQCSTPRHVATFRFLTKHYVSIPAARWADRGLTEASLSLSGAQQFDCHCYPPENSKGEN